MPNTWYPTNIGYIPSGNGATVQVSTVMMGRIVSGTNANQALGFGPNGEIDYVDTVMINLSKRAVDGTLSQKGTITIAVDQLVGIASLPANLNLTLRELDVCDGVAAKKAIVLCSQFY